MYILCAYETVWQINRVTKNKKKREWVNNKMGKRKNAKILDNNEQILTNIDKYRANIDIEA